MTGQGLFSPLLTAQDVAARAKVHVQTVREWVKAGKLHPVPDRGPHGRFQFRVQDVEDQLIRIGVIRPVYQTGALVIWEDRLAQVSTYRPSMGYLIFLGPGSYEWVPEASIGPARPDYLQPAPELGRKPV
jgi:hypothetical protein